MARTANAKIAASASALSDSSAPLYFQIFLILRNKIVDGIFPDRSFLPSELVLAEAFEVSRITAKRALNELAKAGLAVRQGGRGTRVRYRGGGTIVSGSVQSLIDSLRANGRGVPRVLAFDHVPATADVASALQIAERSIVQRAVRVFELDGAPYSHLTTFVPAGVGNAWTEADLAVTPLVTLLERAGLPLEYAEQSFSASLADNTLVEALGVALGSPLLRVVRTSYTTDEMPTEYLVALYAPDRYQFLMTLTKDQNGLH